MPLIKICRHETISGPGRPVIAAVEVIQTVETVEIVELALHFAAFDEARRGG